MRQIGENPSFLRLKQSGHPAGTYYHLSHFPKQAEDEREPRSRLTSSLDFKKSTNLEESVIEEGCIRIVRMQYDGGGPYVVKNEVKEFGTLHPGDAVIMMHVTQHGNEYRKMGYIERVRAIKRDFIRICELIEHPERFNLDPTELAKLKEFKDAPIIAISHLAKYAGNMGIPTWPISDLDRIPRWLLTFSSLQMSRSFGGTRSVKEDDIKAVFISSETRASIVAKSAGKIAPTVV